MRKSLVSMNTKHAELDLSEILGFVTISTSLVFAMSKFSFGLTELERVISATQPGASSVEAALTIVFVICSWLNNVFDAVAKPSPLASRM